MTEETRPMEISADVMSKFKARQEGFEYKAPEASEQKEVKHMRGQYSGELMVAERKNGEFPNGGAYDKIRFGVRVDQKSKKTKVDGKGRWLWKEYSLVDKVNREGEVYCTADEEIDRLLNDLHTMKLPVTFETEKELEGILFEISAKKDMDGNWAEGTGRRVFMDVKPRFNFVSDGKYELKFDDKGYPMHKFEFLPDIPDLVEVDDMNAGM